MTWSLRSPPSRAGSSPGISAIFKLRLAARIDNKGSQLMFVPNSFSAVPCNISGMGMAKPLSVIGIEVTTFHDISRGLENKCLVYIG